MRSRETSPSFGGGSGDSGPVEDAFPTCSHCGGSELIKDSESGGIICASCGLVIRDREFVVQPQWADPDGNGSREPIGVGPPESPLLHDKGLPTEISPKDEDGRGNPLSPKEKALARKLRAWQKRCRVSGNSERNLAAALREIDRMASQLGVPPSVKKAASRIYKKAADEGLVVGRSIESVSSAALYVACRDRQLSRTLDEIGDLAGTDERRVRLAYRSLVRNLNLDLPPPKPTEYVWRFGGELGLSKETSSEAADLLRRAYEKDLVSGKNPTTIAVAALYMAASLNGEKILQREVEGTMNVSQKTVSKRYRQIAEGLGIDIGFQSWRLESFAGTG